MITTDALTSLNDHGVKPSVQRIAVMDYLLKHRTHPTVDEIYQALVGDIPTLSKATVYNTLRLLVDKGAALQLTIDERQTCYDGDTSPHAHFLCRQCGRIYDIALKRPNLLRVADVPSDFVPDSASLYLRGLCPHCKEQGE